MRNFDLNASNASDASMGDVTLNILVEHLGPVFDTLTPEVVENIINAFGDVFDDVLE